MSKAKRNIGKIKSKSLAAMKKIGAYNRMETKGSLTKTAIKTGVETALSVLAGGALGSVIGRPSFFIGLGITALANYSGHYWASPIGLGMMASRAFPSKTVSGLDMKGHLESAKERLVGFKDSLMHRTYLNHVFKSGAGDESTKGIGAVKDGEQAIRQIEKQLMDSAVEFNRQNGTTSGLGELSYSETDFSGM